MKLETEILFIEEDRILTLIIRVRLPRGFIAEHPINVSWKLVEYQINKAYGFEYSHYKLIRCDGDNQEIYIGTDPSIAGNVLIRHYAQEIRQFVARVVKPYGWVPTISRYCLVEGENQLYGHRIESKNRTVKR